MQIMAVYPGRFHPFHRGHAGSFKELVKRFGIENTLLAISGKQEQPKSPFSAAERARMATALGIPPENIIKISQPYRAEEYIQYLRDKGVDPQEIALVFGVSKKDMEGVPELGIPPDPRFEFKPKRDGSPSYLQPFTDEDSVKNIMTHAYVISTNVGEFPIAGETMRDASAIRKAYIHGNQQKRKRILHDLYGDAAEKIKPIFDANLQNIVSEDTQRLVEFLERMRPLLPQATPQQRRRLLQMIAQHRPGVSQQSHNPDYVDER